MSQLSIYKASAGSGKTFSLVRAYLKVLFQNPEEFRHTLGVTFTNKATNEMKQRIIEELKIIVQGGDSKHIAHIATELNRNEAWVRNRGQVIFKQLLHQYHEFHIQTIDSFFQRIIRAFAKDIGLSAGFRLEMDTDYVLESCIKRLMDDLQPDTALTEWLVEFSKEQTEDAKNWDIRDRLFEFSKEIFRESFLNVESKIISFVTDNRRMDALSKQLGMQIKKYADELKTMATEGEALLNKYNLQATDFSGKSRSFMKIFENIKNPKYKLTDTFLNKIGELDTWYAKDTPAEIKDKIENAYTTLNPLLEKIRDYYQANSPIYYSALIAKENLYQLGILAEIQLYIRQYRDENEVMLMPDTTALISRIIEHNEDSFIYEKAGTYFHHFLLDEFQDTSSLQWNNFKPLISNSISQGYMCMLVGDVKQSIYRFRNGDWRLLMYQVEQEIPIHIVHSLNTNYRSSREIVRFNNTIFEHLPALLTQKFKKAFDENEISSQTPQWFVDAYAGHKQHIHKKESAGYVWVKNLKKEAKEQEANWEDLAMHQTVEAVKDALRRGYHMRDIVLLCRNSKESGKLFHRLTQESEMSVSVFSEQSLQISNNSYIQLMISAIRVVAGINTAVETGNMITQYALYLQPEQANNLHKMLINPPFPVREVLEKKQELSHHTLQDLIAVLHVIFSQAGLFRPVDQSFFRALCDELLQYLQEHEGETTHFLSWWEEKGQYKTLKISDTQDAIRIITIHKSKGLEFPVVIIPFCDWFLDHKNNNIHTLWVHPPDILNWDTPLAPIKYKQDVLHSLFAKEYLDEQCAVYLDHLNLLYVALTRAENELYVFLNSADKTDEIKNISTLLWMGLQHTTLNDPDDICVDLEKFLDKEKQVFEMGEKHNIKREQMKDIECAIIRDQAFHFITPWDYTRLRKSPEKRKSWQEKGIEVHEILSRINTWSEVDGVLQLYAQRFKEDSITKDYFEKLFENFQKHPISKRWFDEDVVSLNEQSLIDTDGRILKPDKMVIFESEIQIVDFKTGMPDPAYIHQMKTYCKLASLIYEKKSKGYIYYIHNHSIEEINPDMP